MLQVRTFDHAQVARLGGLGVGFTAAMSSTTSGTSSVDVRIDAGSFAAVSGGNLLSRLQVVALPACALSTPQLAACRTRTPLASSVDVGKQAVSAQIPLTAGSSAAVARATQSGGAETGDTPSATSGQVFILAAATSSEAGSFQATPLSSASRWSVGGGTGGFSWSYPIPAIPVPGGSGPDLSLDYSSQSVDGLVASENSQPSWAGLGWDLGVPFIERRYTGCNEEKVNGSPVTGYANSADDCWAGDVLELSLQGHSSPLVRDTAAGGDVWRPRDDPGWRVERLTGAANGDNNGEYWQVLTPDGTRYTFGRGTQATTGRTTDSAFTVPVFGNNASDPCHAASVAASWCQQAWRWNVDSVMDSHGNTATYFYTQEKNNYSRIGADGSGVTTPYVRSGYVHDIEYGVQAGAEATAAPARVHFVTAPRCTQIAGGGASTCPALTSTSPDSDYPDVPSSQICTANCTPQQSSPTFFTGVLLASVTTQRSTGTGASTAWSDVDRVGFDYTYPKPSDGTSASLWLAAIHRTGLVGGSKALPPVTFAGTELTNRVETGATPLRKVRVTSVLDELGRRIDVTYGTPDACNDANIPVDHADTNTLDCFPAWRLAGDNDAGFGWWYKYLVTQTKVVDTTGGSPPQTTKYTYVGAPAWHYDDTPATPVKKQSWGDWRGYAQVDAVQLSDPAFRATAMAKPLSLTRTRYFRGMDGDRLSGDPMTGTGSRRFSITDSTGTSVQDDPWLSGRVRETQHFALTSSGDPSYELDGGLTGYGVARTTPVNTGTTDPKHDAHLVVPVREVGRQTLISDPGATRTTRTTTNDSTYDAYGQQLTETVTAPGAGAAGGGSDVHCTRTSYARDAATVNAYLVSFPYRVRNYAGTCAAPSALIRGGETYYDGSATLGAPVVHGDATREVLARTASGPDTVSSTIATSQTFDSYGRVLTSTDANNHVNRVSYAPATGIPATNTATNALGQVAVTTLEPGRGQPVSVKDSNNQVTTTGYDPLGRITSVRLPGQAAADPPAYSFAYALDDNRAAAPKTTTRELQAGSTYVTGYQFLDSLGRVRQQQAVSPASTAGAPKAIVTDTRYDDRGLQAAKTLPLVTSATAGAALVSVAGSSASETRSSYDDIARPVSSSFYAAGSLKWSSATAYFGDHTRTTPPSGGVVSTIWTDVLGRQVKTEQGTGSALVATNYRYDDVDEQVSATDPAGHRATYGYDLLGRRTASTDPDSGATSTGYDAAGNVISSTDAANITITTDYDATNRPTSVWKGASGTGTQLDSYSYDSTAIPNGIGRLSSQTAYAAADSQKAYTQAVTGYDTRGRVTGKSWTFPSGTGLTLLASTYKVSYGYDVAGNQTSITYPDRVVGLDPEIVTTAYDALGNPSTLTGTRTPLLGSPTTDTYVSATGYAADGKLSSRDYANPLYPLHRQYGYEPDTQRLSTISTTVGDPIQPGTTVKQDDTYSWDPSGNLSKIVDNAPQVPLIGRPTATCFAYDTLDRISHAWSTQQADCSDSASTLVHDGPSGFNESWTYSPDGNITSARSLLINRTFNYQDQAHPHAVTNAGADLFGYDATGQQNTRLKTAVPGVMTYTPQHQLATLTEGLTTTRFVYGADGSRLVRFNPDGSATLYIDGEELLVVAGVAKGTRFYSEAGSTVAVRNPAGILTWQLNDTQGSAQVSVLSGTGLLSRTYYDPYGKQRDLSASPVTDRGYLGKPADPSTGLDALGARYYDPDLERFISPDPLNVTSNAQTANPYGYAANNPVMYSDPTGLEPHTADCNLACSEGLDQPSVEVSSHPGTVYTTPPPAPVRVAKKQSFWGRLGGGIKDTVGGLGSGAWDIGPGLVGDTIGLIPTDWASDFQQGVEDGKTSMTKWYGADTSSTAYKTAGIGIIIASMMDGEGEAKGAVEGGSKIKSIWNWGRNLLKSDKAEVGGLRDAAADARRVYQVGSRRNVAVADVKIGGGEGERLIGVSGQAERAGTVGVPKDPVFNPRAGDVSRPLDAEYKILEDVASRTDRDATGTINLYTEREACPACSSVVQQFQERFPGIKVNVFSGGG